MRVLVYRITHVMYHFFEQIHPVSYYPVSSYKIAAFTQMTVPLKWRYHSPDHSNEGATQMTVPLTRSLKWRYHSPDHSNDGTTHQITQMTVPLRWRYHSPDHLNDGTTQMTVPLTRSLKWRYHSNDGTTHQITQMTVTTHQIVPKEQVVEFFAEALNWALHVLIRQLNTQSPQ
jgi:hypothetical protein